MTTAAATIKCSVDSVTGKVLSVKVSVDHRIVYQLENAVPPLLFGVW